MVAPSSCGQPECKYQAVHDHKVSLIRRGAETFISYLTVPRGQRGLRCVICDVPSEKALCDACRV